jgi:prepilin peptidase CpaA
LTLAIYLFLLLQLFIVSWVDIRTRKISNFWSILNAAILAPVLYIFVQDLYPWDWTVLIFPAGWILIGFFLFLLGIMGAGDSKYLASVFAVVPPDLQMVMFSQLVNATLLIGGFLILLKIAKDFQKIKAYALNTYWLGLKEIFHSRFSYAPVIFIAWIFVGLKLWM